MAKENLNHKLKASSFRKNLLLFKNVANIDLKVLRASMIFLWTHLVSLPVWVNFWKILGSQVTLGQPLSKPNVFYGVCPHGHQLMSQTLEKQPEKKCK